jgi:hypothetical protein
MWGSSPPSACSTCASQFLKLSLEGLNKSSLLRDFLLFSKLTLLSKTELPISLVVRFAVTSAIQAGLPGQERLKLLIC